MALVKDTPVYFYQSCTYYSKQSPWDVINLHEFLQGSPCHPFTPVLCNELAQQWEGTNERQCDKGTSKQVRLSFTTIIYMKYDYVRKEA